MNYRSDIPSYVSDILDLVNSAGYEAYVVGGAVRDLLVGRRPHDFDLASDATPDQIVKLFEENHIRYVDMAAKHGTITAITPDGNIEITTFRSDGIYEDARHPADVTFTRSIEEDVSRRDFTINSLYLDPDGEIRDLTGGMEDISKHLIRAVGDPVRRFEEDALRILRAIRFEALLGFDIEPKTKDAMDQKASNLELISSERIQSEFIYMLRCPFASKAIRDNLDILSIILPELRLMKGFDQKSRYHDLDMLEHTLKVLDGIPLREGDRPLRDSELAAAALLHDMGKPSSFVIDRHGFGHMKGHPEISKEIAIRVLSGLKCTKAFINDVAGLVELHDTFIPCEKTAVHRFMCEHDEAFLARLALLQRADIDAHSELGKSRIVKLEGRLELEKQLRDEGAAFSVSDLKIGGDDLIRLGVPTGPRIGQILDELFELYLNGQTSNEAFALEQKAKGLI